MAEAGADRRCCVAEYEAKQARAVALEKVLSTGKASVEIGPLGRRGRRCCVGRSDAVDAVPVLREQLRDEVFAPWVVAAKDGICRHRSATS